jgi:3' exoribonuclease, RNase T-like
MSYSQSEVMLDIETLSTLPNAAVVSIGAVKFSLDKGILSSFKVNIDPVSCKDHGLHFEKKTIDWWAEQPKAARQAWMKDPRPLGEALQYFLTWYGASSRPTWAKGASFDFPILESAIRSCEYDIPWKYWHINCYRTIINVCGIDDRKLKSEGSVYHDAISDCEEQTKVLIPLLRAMRGLD